MPWSSRIAIELWRGRRAASPRRLLRDKVLPAVLPIPISPPLAEPLIDVGFCQHRQVGQVIFEPVGVLLLVGQLLAHQGIEGRPDADVTEVGRVVPVRKEEPSLGHIGVDRKSTRLNSSHSQISYAVFCLKKKNTTGELVPPRRAL